MFTIKLIIIISTFIIKIECTKIISFYYYFKKILKF